MLELFGGWGGCCCFGCGGAVIFPMGGVRVCVSMRCALLWLLLVSFGRGVVCIAIGRC